MRRYLKWLTVGAVGLSLLLLSVVAVLATIGNRKLNLTYRVQPGSISLGAETANLQRGQYLYSVSCAGCHGDDLGGTVFFDEPALGRLPAPNLTGGHSGVGNFYSETDFVRAIRHGIDNEGRSLMIMPASAFWYFSDADLGAIIAYIQSARPVDSEPREKELSLLGLVLVGAGVLDVLAAEHIDHEAPRPDIPAQQVDASYGKYLANSGDCRSCHGPTLTGGQPPEPGAPFAPDLSPAGALAQWRASEFITAMRSGSTPDGRTIDASFMPWEAYSRLSDDDLTAIFLYLQSLPATVTEE